MILIDWLEIVRCSVGIRSTFTRYNIEVRITHTYTSRFTINTYYILLVHLRLRWVKKFFSNIKRYFTQISLNPLTCCSTPYLVYEEWHGSKLFWSIEKAMHDDDMLVRIYANGCQWQQKQQLQRHRWYSGGWRNSHLFLVYRWSIWPSRSLSEWLYVLFQLGEHACTSFLPSYCQIVCFPPNSLDYTPFQHLLRQRELVLLFFI